MSFGGRPNSPFSPHRASRGPPRNDLPTPLHLNTNGRVHGIRNPDLLSPQRSRSSSVHSKGKPPEHGPVGTSSNVYDLDHYPVRLNASSTTFSTFENSLRAAHPDVSTLPKRGRTSFFGAASDALNFKKFNKKKGAISTSSPGIFLPEVIAITSTRRESMVEDTEEEERERLRDAAAQSIGLDPEIMADKLSRQGHESDEETDGEANGESTSLFTSREGEAGLAGSPRTEYTPSFSSPLAGRNRASSVAHSVNHRRSRSYSTTPIPTVPMFPTTVSGLTQFTQINAVLPKHYPAPSLLKFSLSKQWKNRYIIMTSSTQAVGHSPRPTSAPTVSYLHLFKSHNSSEKEIERLEINEDSVVFVNEHNEDIAGRRNVLRVGGVDCGAMKKVFNLEENGRTMWLFQVTDPQELQKWITAIKNSVLGQRSVRAGLGLPAHSLDGAEPRGDLDVMLSIRAQGIMSPPTKTGFDITRARGVSVTSHPSIGHDQSISSSSHSVPSTNHSLRSQATPSSPKPPAIAVSALKGLFTGSNRPRSPSIVASSGSEDTEESSGVLGNSLLTTLQASNERPMSPLSSNVMPTPDASPTLSQLEPLLRGEIAQNRLPIDHWASFRPVQPSNNRDSVLPFRVEHPFGGSSSLQPPPRRRATTVHGPPSNSLDAGPYKYIHANSSTAESFGVGQTVPTTAVVTPISSPQTSLGTTDRKPRAPSWSSTSSFASGASGSSGSGSKRWSRQGNTAHVLTPPSGSPPMSVPQTDGASTPRIQSPHPYAMDRSSSHSSSKSSMSPHIAASNNLFSKRASGSSFQTISTVSSHTRAATTGNRTSNRLSVPPPQRPAPTIALPPTPSGDGNSKPPSPPPPAKLTFRDTFAHRALRLSVAGPPQRKPPSSVLPPRPDEPGFASHRRSNSGSSIPRQLYSIPASPLPSDIPGSVPQVPPPQALADANKQHISIKQRLRMLSAPSPSPTSSGLPQSSPTAQSFVPSPDSTDDSPSSAHFVIGEPITTMQNDPNFLLMPTPVISPPTPPLWNLPPDPTESTVSSPEMPEIASLPPPPWRALRRSSVPNGDIKDGDDNDDDDSSLKVDRPRVCPPALSSAISIANLSS